MKRLGKPRDLLRVAAIELATLGGFASAGAALIFGYNKVADTLVAPSEAPSSVHADNALPPGSDSTSTDKEEPHKKSATEKYLERWSGRAPFSR